MNLRERLETLGLALVKAKIMEPLEALGYTVKEFAAMGKGSFMGEEIRGKGVRVG